MTEDEAKTKWCPAYRVATSGGEASSTFEMDNRPREWAPPPKGSDAGASYTPGLPVIAVAACIASACMAWRRTNARPTMGEEASGQRDGFCGLAGAPQ